VAVGVVAIAQGPRVPVGLRDGLADQQPALVVVVAVGDQLVAAVVVLASERVWLSVRRVAPGLIAVAVRERLADDPVAGVVAVVDARPRGVGRAGIAAARIGQAEAGRAPRQVARRIVPKGRRPAFRLHLFAQLLVGVVEAHLKVESAHRCQCEIWNDCTSTKGVLQISRTISFGLADF